MKKLLGLIILPLAFFLACDTGSSSDPGNNVDPGGNQMMVGALVKDANGVLLGSVLDTYSSGIKIMTPTGYIIPMLWEGGIRYWQTSHFNNVENGDLFFEKNNVLYATEADMEGDIFIPASTTKIDYCYGKMAFVFGFNDGQIYTFRDIDANNIAAVDSDFSTNYESYAENVWSYGTTYENSPGDFTAYPNTDAAFVLKKVTKTEIGLPATIVPPLSFSIE